jgi:hypothetical protein
MRHKGGILCLVGEAVLGMVVLGMAVLGMVVLGMAVMRRRWLELRCRFAKCLMLV